MEVPQRRAHPPLLLPPQPLLPRSVVCMGGQGSRLAWGGRIVHIQGESVVSMGEQRIAQDMSCKIKRLYAPVCLQMSEKEAARVTATLFEAMGRAFSPSSTSALMDCLALGERPACMSGESNIHANDGR